MSCGQATNALQGPISHGGADSGAMMGRQRCYFLIPLAFVTMQLGVVLYLQRQLANKPQVAPAVPLYEPPLHSPARTKTFLRMAWLANPFAYIGINTLIAVMPGVAAHLGLTATQVGFYCSLWELLPGWLPSSSCGNGRDGITSSAGWAAPIWR